MSIPPLAVYLVAGRGSRLGNMTEETPKCLISINKEPLLTRSLIQISALGVKKVILVVGYKSDVIKKDIINIENDRTIVRDKNSKALLSVNYEGLKAYKIERNRNNKILEYENDINTLKEDVTEIRTALELLVKKLT